MWKYYCDYFFMYLIKIVDLDFKDNYIFVYYLYGIMGFGVLGIFCGEVIGFLEKFLGICFYFLFFMMNFRFFFIRDFSMVFGVCLVDKDSIDYIL